MASVAECCLIRSSAVSTLMPSDTDTLLNTGAQRQSPLMLHSNKHNKGMLWVFFVKHGDNTMEIYAKLPKEWEKAAWSVSGWLVCPAIDRMIKWAAGCCLSRFSCYCFAKPKVSAESCYRSPRRTLCFVIQWGVNTLRTFYLFIWLWCASKYTQWFVVFGTIPFKSTPRSRTLTPVKTWFLSCSEDDVLLLPGLFCHLCV